MLAFAAAVLIAAIQAYDPSAVYSQDNRSAIDSRCTDARKAADYIAKDVGAVTPADAQTAQIAFLSCIKLPRTPTDMNKERVDWLILAAAGAAYIESTKANGAARESAIQRGINWVAQLTPVTNEMILKSQMTRVPTGQVNTDAAPSKYGDPSQPASGRYVVETNRNPLGRGAEASRYAEPAKSLRDALLAQISADAPASK